MNSFIRTNLLGYCPEISTRILLETSIDDRRYSIEYAETERDFVVAVEKRQHDIFIIDTSGNDGEDRLSLLKSATSQRLKGLVRMLVLLDRVPDPAANRMQPFGPLCFLECFFTRERLNSILTQIFEIKDTGVRVKIDPKFFDITIFSSKSQQDS
ncbi:MAG: hypothetical protein AB1546_03860 [bacterium]